MFKEKKITAKTPLRMGVRKGVAVLTIIILLFSVFCFSVSSASVTGPDLNGMDLEYIDITVEGYSESQDWATSIEFYQNGSYYRYAVKNSISVFPANTKLKVTFDIGSQLTSNDYLCLGNFYIGTTQNASEYVIENINYNRRFTMDDDYNYIYYQEADVSKITTFKSSFPAIYTEYNTQKLGSSFDTYQVCFDITTGEAASTLYFYFFTNNLEMIDSATNTIVENQNENTDKLIEAEKELQENEKQEAQESGDKGAGDVASAVPNYSGNLLGALDALKDYICHENTDCGFYSPAIKIPKIGNYIPQEIVLLDSQWIALDETFNTLTNKMQNVLTVVKSLLSIGLILFCFKELYDFFEYIMTLRGGKNSE